MVIARKVQLLHPYFGFSDGRRSSMGQKNSEESAFCSTRFRFYPEIRVFTVANARKVQLSLLFLCPAGKTGSI